MRLLFDCFFAFLLDVQREPKLVYTVEGCVYIFMMDKFKYAYIVTTNRAFSSNWPGVSLMVPYADYLNHENVDTTFDCVD